MILMKHVFSLFTYLFSVGGFPPSDFSFLFIDRLINLSRLFINQGLLNFKATNNIRIEGKSLIISISIYLKKLVDISFQRYQRILLSAKRFLRQRRQVQWIFINIMNILKSNKSLLKNSGLSLWKIDKEWQYRKISSNACWNSNSWLNWFLPRCLSWCSDIGVRWCHPCCLFSQTNRSRE